MKLMLLFLVLVNLNSINGKKNTEKNSTLKNDPGLKKSARVDVSKWNDKASCISNLPDGWIQISENSKYLLLTSSSSNRENRTATDIQGLCEHVNLNLNLAGISHLADWFSLQKFLIHRFPTDDTGLMVLSDIFNDGTNRWENHYSGKRPFGIWLDKEPNDWAEKTINVFRRMQNDKNLIGINDIKSSDPRTYLVICQYPYDTTCFQASAEEQTAARKNYYDEEPIFLGETDKFVWHLGPDQRSYMDAKRYCEENGYILFDRNTTLSASESKELGKMLDSRFKEINVDVRNLGRLDFTASDSSTPGRGATRLSYNPNCLENPSITCFQNSGDLRSFAFHFFMCFEPVTGPFNTEGL